MKKSLTLVWQTSTIALLCVAMMVMPGCSAATVIADIGKFAPAVINVAEAVCAFTPAAPICLTAGPAVQASTNVLITALNNYYAAQAAGSTSPTIVQDLQTAISTFEANASQILDAVHVVDAAHQADVEAVAAAAATLLAVIESLLPAQVTANKFSASRPKTVFNLNAWTGDYNAKVDTLQHSLPRNVTLKHVHAHPLLLRVIPGIH